MKPISHAFLTEPSTKPSRSPPFPSPDAGGKHSRLTSPLSPSLSPPDMDPSFRFDPDGSDDEAATRRSARGGKAQSAWDFSSYTESVAAEHARRHTTSIDEKISLARQGRRKPVLSDDSEADESGGSGVDDSDEEDEEALVEGESSGDEEEEVEESEDDEEEAVEGSGDDDEEVEAEDQGEDEEDGGEQGEEDEEKEVDSEEVSSLISCLVLFSKIELLVLLYSYGVPFSSLHLQTISVIWFETHNC